jgi:hypothetical protein
MTGWVISSVVLLAVLTQARSSAAQTSCLSTRVAPGSVLTTCQDPSRPARGADLNGAVVTPESIGAWRALEIQRLRIEEQRLRNEILRRQSERAIGPPATSAGTLAFATQMAGVDLWLDGKWRGRTVIGERMVVANLSPGQHWIEVRVADRVWSGAITVEAERRAPALPGEVAGLVQDSVAGVLYSPRRLSCAFPR